MKQQSYSHSKRRLKKQLGPSLFFIMILTVIFFQKKIRRHEELEEISPCANFAQGAYDEK